MSRGGVFCSFANLLHPSFLRWQSVNRHTLRACLSHNTVSGANFNTDRSSDFNAQYAAKEANETSSHMYSNLYPWKDSTQLAEHLLNSQVYNEKGLIICCKPYGVSNSRNIQSAHSHGRAASTQLTLKDALPRLKEILSVDHLEVLLTPERWCSGFLALSSCSKVTKNFRHSHFVSSHRKWSNRTYMLVTFGVPAPASMDACLRATQLVDLPGLGRQVPVVLDKFSKRQMKTGKISLLQVSHETLASNEQKTASLVKVQSSTSRNHSQRVWLAKHLSPVLGDDTYGARVVTLLGRRVPVPHVRAAIGRTIYPYEFLQKLDLTPSTQDMMPVFSHLSSFRLPEYLPKPTNKQQNNVKEIEKTKSKSHYDYSADGRELVVHVPPPEHFIWTLEQLGIPYDYNI